MVKCHLGLFDRFMTDMTYPSVSHKNIFSVDTLYARCALYSCSSFFIMGIVSIFVFYIFKMFTNLSFFRIFRAIFFHPFLKNIFFTFISFFISFAYLFFFIDVFFMMILVKTFVIFLMILTEIRETFFSVRFMVQQLFLNFLGTIFKIALVS